MISLIYGPSGSGKTYRLIRAYILADRYNQKAIIIKPKLPNPELNTRTIEYDGEVQITENVFILGEDVIPRETRYNFLLVENVQFLSPVEIHTILDTYSSVSDNIVFYGTPHNYAGVPFPSVQYLLDNRDTLLDVVEKLPAKCYRCKAPNAEKTQRLINGIPAPITPEIFIEDFVVHKPACDKCYVSPEEVSGLIKEKSHV